MGRVFGDRQLTTRWSALLAGGALVAAALAFALFGPSSGPATSAADAATGARTSSGATGGKQPCIVAKGVTASRPCRNLRAVIFAGNNWEGTADVIYPGKRFGRITRINIIPDFEERWAEIQTDPERLGYYLAIRELVGEGNDQFVDDMYTTHDGEILIVSRPSLRDVIGMDLDTREIIWRFVVDGQRSDHMAISPDGEHVAVSASTGNVVHILNTRTGEEVGQFPSGDSPHENIYSPKGTRLIHASIGRVYTPVDEPALDTNKGVQVLQLVKTSNNHIYKKFNIRKKLEEAGYPDMSAAVRPMALAPKGKMLWFQVSFFHGFVEFSLKKNKVTRVIEMPISDEAAELSKEEYLLDSAHHGLAINPSGRKLCVAGTMSDYAAIVDRSKGFEIGKILTRGTKPYWATTSHNGKWCLVSWSGTDSVSVISYKTGREYKRIPVGDHPQRVRMTNVRRDWIRSQG